MRPANVAARDRFLALMADPANSGRPVAELAAEAGVRPGTAYEWRRKYLPAAGRRRRGGRPLSPAGSEARRLLADPKTSRWSDGRIGRAVDLHPSTVAHHRDAMRPAGQSGYPARRAKARARKANASIAARIAAHYAEQAEARSDRR